MKQFSKEEALELAKKYHLEAEVRYAIEKAGLTPNDALEDWDLYPFE